MHSQELQALRAQSHEGIEQLRAAHQSTVESLKAEHAVALENQAKQVEKQIANQTLELNATREDLARAKAAQNGAGKKPKSAAPSTGTSTPVTTVADSPTEAHLSYGTGKPDKALFDAEQNKIKAEIDALQLKLVSSSTETLFAVLASPKLRLRSFASLD